MDILAWLTEAAASTQMVWYLPAVAFLAGVLVSFTPCVYPMIPITVGMLQGQATGSVLRNVLTALCYVLGVATVYASLGYLSAKTSLLFGSWMGMPWVIALVVALFLYLAFSLLGFYELYVPAFLRQQHAVAGKSSAMHAYLLGLVAGTVASPCLTPALAMLLGVVAREGNPFMGFVTLFAFALGMGLLLLIVGSFSATLGMLPRSGVWMEQIKQGFGFLTLAVCVSFLRPLLPLHGAEWGYGGVALAASGYFFLKRKESVLAGILASMALLLAAGYAAYVMSALTF